MRLRQHKPGQEVRTTGIYVVHHRSHGLMHEVTLQRGILFPCCKQCGNAVRFELSRSVKSATFVPFQSGDILQKFEQKSASMAAGE